MPTPTRYAQFTDQLDQALQPLRKGLMNTTRNTNPFRTALIAGKDITAERVAAYLPSNYEVVDADVVGADGDTVIVGGHDVAGWGLDTYVIPRLASGAMFAVEMLQDEIAAITAKVEPPVRRSDQFVDQADYNDSAASDQCFPSRKPE